MQEIAAFRGQKYNENKPGNAYKFSVFQAVFCSNLVKKSRQKWYTVFNKYGRNHRENDGT